MRSPKSATLALLLATVVMWSLVPLASGQSGGVSVNADYELFGTNALSGGGHVTWTLTGDAARQFRADLVNLFDNYTQIPRGFLFGGGTTTGNGDGTIQTSEGLAYTDRLENVLEGVYPSGNTGGTQVGYFHLDRADLFDKDPATGFSTSTSGILGSDANSTASLQIRFLFNGATDTGDVSMPLSTEAYAEALYRVFSIEADQTGAWPLSTAAVGSPGWHLVYLGTTPALWAGNTSTCTTAAVPSCPRGFYDNGSDLDGNVVMDPGLGTAGTWLDLRFASSAWITFDYTGQVADASDAMRVQVAPFSTSPVWAGLTGGNFSFGDNTNPGAWMRASLNLSAYLGQRVLLRLNFTSDGSGSASGFFVRNFSIHGPATYQGTVTESDAHYLVGTLSFSNFNVPSGSPTLIRTPGGEILFYSSRFEMPGVAPDTVRYEGFDPVENPQVLFAIMCIAAYGISRLQDDAYDNYREAHPSIYRPAVHKVKWLHWAGRITILVLILLYFIPTAFFAIGLRLYFNGPAYIFLALTVSLFLGFGTRAYYMQLLEETPPPAAAAEGETGEPVPAGEAPVEVQTVAHCTHCLRPIREGEKTYPCSCGAVYHVSCASGLIRCANCRKPIAGLETLSEKRSVSMRCSSCGELQNIPEGTDARTLTCASCGGSLRRLDAGKRYLLVASNPAIAFHWLSDLAKGGKAALIMTTAAPERLRLEFSLPDVTFAQIASQGSDAIDPKKLDPAGLRAILPLARAGKGGIILYDGLDQMVTAASLGDVIRFLRKANDMAFVHQITVIGRVAPGLLAETEIQRLAAEFDETLDLSARL